MAGIDPDKPFHPLHIAILTISDTRTMESDSSGALLVSRLEAAGHKLAARALVPDDVTAIRAQAERWIADDSIDLIITTGGTGFSTRDVTPEAIKPLFDREMDGFSVVFHMKSLETVGVSTLQSRAFAGQAQGTFLFCLPGSTGACRDAWDGIFAFELDSRYRPCSIVAHVPRLQSAAP